ncbi:MAG: hypothetical protein IJT08_01900 [Alphaproteobacteria bacterium]|nr:hypothetical protein [Alphaproteobacteria bacterium]
MVGFYFDENGTSGSSTKIPSGNHEGRGIARNCIRSSDVLRTATLKKFCLPAVAVVLLIRYSIERALQAR